MLFPTSEVIAATTGELCRAAGFAVGETVIQPYVEAEGKCYNNQIVV